MRVLVAMNEFKGSLTSSELGEIIKNKIDDNFPNAKVSMELIADGGDGFLSVFKKSCKKTFLTKNSIGKEIEVEYRLNIENKEAIIEVAEIIGLKQLSSKEKDPYKTSTVGIGTLINYLLENNIKNFIIGLGGSSTNDCGLGMLSKLGYKFYDKDGNLCKEGIADLKNVFEISDFEVNPKLKDAKFTIICDVDNPLYGSKGATYVYAGQKGLSRDKFEQVDTYVKNFSKLVNNTFKKDFSKIPGSGAAGGLGYAFITFMNAQIKKGSEFVIEYLRLDEKLANVDILITGEGKLDKQSFMGKAPIEVARVAKKYGVNVIFLAGSVLDDELETLCYDDKKLIDASFSVQRGIYSLEEAMDKKVAMKNLERTIEQICSLLKFSYEKTK